MKTTTQKAIRRGKAAAHIAAKALDAETLRLWGREQMAAALEADRVGAEADATRLAAAAMEAERLAA